MTYRLTSLLAIAAVLAVPALASAATMREPAVRSMTPSTSVAIPPPSDDAPAVTMAAERNYLANTCPSVLAHPANYTAVLNRFCQEFHG